jgi:hypothetical protein
VSFISLCKFSHLIAWRVVAYNELDEGRSYPIGVPHKACTPHGVPYGRAAPELSALSADRAPSASTPGCLPIRARRISASDIRGRTADGKIVVLTAYHTYTARIVDDYCNVILVGDSLGNVLYGYTTLPVTLRR